MARQGITRPYGSDSSDAGRLVGEVAAILSIGAGVIHISAAGDHTELPVMFAGFMLVAALQIALGVVLLRGRPSRLIIAAAVAMALASIGLWVLSRTAGLPFIEGGHVEAIGFKDGVTKLLEIASIPMLVLLLSPDLSRVSLPSSRLGGQTRAAVGTACVALLVPALLLSGGEHHTHAEAVALGIHDEHGESPDDGHDPAAHNSESAHAHADGENGAGRHEHAGSTHAEEGHEHPEFASTLGATHEHGTVPTHAHSEPTDGAGEHDHGGGQHHHGRHDGDKQHGHDHGDGGHGESDGGSDGEQAISVSYEPEPRVCLTAICLP